jgi:pSer/pThr/pTyr-binding forkhead associated (FHA) protein
VKRHVIDRGAGSSGIGAAFLFQPESTSSDAIPMLTSVSRRHARLVVTAEGTVLEDCGSKNGTFLGGERVTSPVALADGDAIHIGSLLVTFHVQALIMSTDTHARPLQ